MRKVFGCVVVKETNVGIPNVVVAAYDGQDDVSRSNAGQSPAELLRHPARRIGSVLTDAKGHFVLTAEDLSFTGNETRPDLLIAVFAAEDVQGVNNPVPLPPEDRVLYLSAKARVDAGAEEAYVIRLLQAQVDKFQIPLTMASQQGPTDMGKYAATIRSVWAFRDGATEAMKPRMQTEVAADRTRRRAAEKFVGDLSGIPAHLQPRDTGKKKSEPHNHDRLIPNRKQLAEKLPELQSTVVSEALQRLDKATTKPKVRLHLSLAELEELGLKYEDGKLSGRTSARRLAAAIRGQMKGADLQRTRTVGKVSPDELERRYLLAPASAPKPSNKQPVSRRKNRKPAKKSVKGGR